MIVEAPDGKTIDFGDIHQDQVVAAMSELYPPQQQAPVYPKGATAQEKATQDAAARDTAAQEAMLSGGAGRRVVARLTGYGANAVSAIPGLKEAGSALAAMAGAGEGQNFSDRYASLQEAQAAMRKAGETTDPGATTLGNVSSTILGLGLGGKIAGSVAGHIARTAPKTAAAVTAFQKAHPYWANTLASIPVGAAYGAGEGTSAGERMRNAAVGAGIGALTAAPITAVAEKVVAPAVGKVASLFSKSAPAQKMFSKTPSSEELSSHAGSLFKQADELGGILKPEFTNKFVAEIDKMRPQTKVGQVISGDSAFTKTIERMANIKNEPVTLAGAQEIDEALSEAIDGFVDAGRLTKQGKKLLDIQSTFRDMIEKATPEDLIGGSEGFAALKEARRVWAASRRMADVERIMTRAELMDVPATGIKTGFRTLLSNPSRIRGFSKAERAAIKTAAETGLGTEALRLVGSRLVPLLTGAVSWSVPATGAAMAVSAAARRGAAALQRKRANRVLDEIARPFTGRVREPPPVTGLAPAGLAATNPLQNMVRQ